MQIQLTQKAARLICGVVFPSFLCIGITMIPRVIQITAIILPLIFLWYGVEGCAAISCEEWKKAVVHLEVAADSLSWQNRIKRLNEIRKSRKNGGITPSELFTVLYGSMHDVRRQGTAIFLKHESRRYLVTVRHLVYDKETAQREFNEKAQGLSSPKADFRRTIIAKLKRIANRRMYNVLFRVPSLDDVLSGREIEQKNFLTKFTPHTFSTPELDLAVISLDQGYQHFADHLVSSGHEPISLDDIADGPTGEGADVYSVGYPGAIAILGKQTIDAKKSRWSSSLFSLPSFAFGKVSMLHNSLPFYYCDISIYPGNSGGPIVEGGKLVGIVSGQPAIPIEEKSNGKLINAERLFTRIPFGKIIKAGFVKRLLAIQIERDREMHDQASGLNH